MWCCRRHQGSHCNHVGREKTPPLKLCYAHAMFITHYTNPMTDNYKLHGPNVRKLQITQTQRQAITHYTDPTTGYYRLRRPYDRPLQITGTSVPPITDIEFLITDYTNIRSPDYKLHQPPVPRLHITLTS